MEETKRKSPMRLLRYTSDNASYGELFEMARYNKYKYVIRENNGHGEFQFYNASTKDQALELVDERVNGWKKDGLSVKVDVFNEAMLN